jgi:hypothetical protein
MDNRFRFEHALKNKSKQIKRPLAGTSPERLKRLKALNARVKGTFVDFITQEDLKTMREDAKWTKIK